MLINQNGICYSACVKPKPLGNKLVMQGFDIGISQNDCCYCHSSAFDGKYLWINRVGTKIVRFDVDTKEKLEYPIENGINGNTNIDINAFAHYSSVYDGQYIWYMPENSHVNNNLVIRLDTSTGTMIGIENPQVIQYTGNVQSGTFDGKYRWGIASGGSFLHQLDVATGRIALHNWIDYPSLDFLYLIFDGQHLYAVDRSRENNQSLYKIDPRTLNVQRFYIFKDEESSYFRVPTFDGQCIWLFSEVVKGQCIVAKFDIATSLFKKYELYDGQNGSAELGEDVLSYYSAVFDGRYIWLSPSFSNRLLRFDTYNISMQGYTISGDSVGKWSDDPSYTRPRCRDIEFDGKNLWVIPFESDKLLRISSNDTMYQLVESYVDQKGNPLQANNIVWLEPDEDYTQTAPRIPGYKRLGHRIDNNPDQTTHTATIENVQQDHTVTFLYEPCDGEYCQDILITESYYDVANDTYIRPDTYEYLAQGDDYRKLAPSIPGYKRVGHRIDDNPDLLGITAEILDVAGDHHVHFLYEPGDEEPGLDVPVIEKYFDLASNTYIRPDTTTYVELGGTYRKTAPTIAGYERVGHRVDAGPSSSSLTAVIADVRETHVVTLLYEPDDEGGTIPPREAIIITERYFDVENQSFIQSDTYTRVRKGADYEKTAPAITGYDRVGHQIDGGAAQTNLTAQIMYVQESHVVTFLYEPDEGGGIDPGDKIVITEEYYDVINRTYIQPDTQTRVDRGTDYQKTAPSLSGYHRLGHQVDVGTPQGSFTARIDNVQETHTVTFLYQPDDGGGSTEPPEDGILITERYYDIVGRKYLLSDTYTKVARGATYQKTAPAISGYFRVGHRVDNGPDQTPIIAVIQNVQEPHVVTFLYEPAIDCDDFVIRERYYDKQNDVYIRPDTETLVEPGGDYRKTAPEITGCKRVGHKVDNGPESTSLTAVIENVRDDHTVTFLYIPDDGGSGEDGEFVITERYYDVENGVYIRPDTHTTVKAGDDYAKTAPELIGYVRIGHRVDDGNESAELTATIPNVREEHIVTFLYKPEDDNGGKDPEPGPGDGNGCCCCCCKCMPAMPMMMCVPVMPMMCMPWGNGCGCCSCSKPKDCTGKKPREDNKDDCH